jgi:hypothetical protein
MRATSNADARKSAAVARKTTSVLVSASRNPPSAGPTKMPIPSVVLDATFEAVSSSGVRASEGTSAAWAGRKAVPATLPTIASA